MARGFHVTKNETLVIRGQSQKLVEFSDIIALLSHSQALRVEAMSQDFVEALSEPIHHPAHVFL